MDKDFIEKHKRDLILVVVLVVALLASAVGVVLYRASIPKHEVVVTSGGAELFRVPLSEEATYGVVDGQAVKFDNPDITLADMGEEAEESKHHINIIRVGLKSSDHIRTGGSIAGTTFHPAFRQLVEGEIAKERIEEQLAASGFVPRSSRNPKREVLCMANARGLSNLVGNGGRNRKYFLDKYPGIVLSYRVCNELHDGEYIARIKGDK